VTAHPGEVLNEEFLKPLGMSVNALAIALRVPATRMGAIVKGERAVTADTALRLARFYGTSPEFWMNLQAMHDLTKARMESGKAIARDVRPRAAWLRDAHISFTLRGDGCLIRVISARTMHRKERLVDEQEA
jgi:antitoxin HigA-1